jgi:hypothetical protein
MEQLGATDMTTIVYTHIDKVENESLTQSDWNTLSQTMEDLTGAGMDSKADKNGNSEEDFNSKKMTVHEDLTLQSGVAVNRFSDDATLSGDSDTTVPTEKAIKAYADTKASLAGDPSQDYETNDLRVYGNLEVTGTTISRDVEQMQGDVELGNADSDTVTVAGVLTTGNTSNKLMIASDTDISGSLKLQSGEVISDFSADTSLTDNSDAVVPTQKAIKAYTDNLLSLKSDQTTLDNEISAINSQLVNKANISGNSGQAFDTANLTVTGDLTVTGSVIADLTQDLSNVDLSGVFENDVVLGNNDNNTVEIMGKLISGNTSDNLVIEDSAEVRGSLSLQSGETVNEFSADGTLADDSDTAVPTERAVKAYADSVQQAAQAYTDQSTTNSVINNTETSTADLNTLKTVGVYAVSNDNANSPTGMPTDSDYNMLTVYQNTDVDSGVQILRSADHDDAGARVFTYQRSWQSSGFTDWQQSLFINNDGNVGIGTLTPTANLEIKGDLLLDTGVAISEFSTDGTLRGNSDTSVPTENAVKTYADTKAKLAGDSTQNFYTNKLRVNGGLRVSGLSGTGISNYHYLNQTGVGHISGSSGNTSSVSAQYKVSASEFMAYSDYRIKKDLSLTDSQEDLNTLNQLELTNYHYIDGVGNGSHAQKKLIAQQVETVYPQAVTQGEDFIPNVYQSSVSTSYDESTQHLEIVLNAKHDLAQNDEVRIMSEAGQEDHQVVAVADEYSFTVSCEAPQDQVFVFGKKVDDFKQVDYTAISMLGMSAIQQLSKENNRLRTETEQLKQLLQACSERLDALEQK